jgi:8-oxo-dGTP pyrophosphatase MutT (NUDIX family)
MTDRSPNLKSLRPSVRVVCLDASERVLLLQWEDPHSHQLLWEPPGGGIDAGETPYAAAQRELTEETGLSGASVQNVSVNVDRDAMWKGQRHLGQELFFIARFNTDRPALRSGGLVGDEPENFRAFAWTAIEELFSLDGLIEPPHLLEVIRELEVLEASTPKPPTASPLTVGADDTGDDAQGRHQATLDEIMAKARGDALIRESKEPF